MAIWTLCVNNKELLFFFFLKNHAPSFSLLSLLNRYAWKTCLTHVEGKKTCFVWRMLHFYYSCLNAYMGFLLVIFVNIYAREMRV
jgi:hypothetical protein